ncbi:MAG: type II toxin-antitoxin system PemK/MazF family toxin [Candidatus Paceibacterota bacterium]|jgi:mRNA interferase MazF
MEEIKQGEIYLLDFGKTGGHEQSGYRPAMVIQNDVLNSKLSTIIVAPITSNVKAAGKATTFFLPKEKYKLKFDSVVLLFQMSVVDRKMLRKMVAVVNKEDFLGIKKQINLIF